jgi:hypothetical protein
LSPVESAGRAQPSQAELASDPSDVSPEEGADLAGLLAGYERSLILAALAAVGGRQRSAAGLLRILPSTLNEKMKRLGIRAQRAGRRLAAPAGAEVSASLHWSGSVPPGGVVEVRGLNGPVRVEASGDERVEVLAARRGPSALVSALEVKVVEHARGVTVCSVWQGLAPSASRRVERRLCRGVADVRVDIVARVPPGVRVVASTINGDIEVVGLASFVEADTANGRVRLLPCAPPLPAAEPHQAR